MGQQWFLVVDSDRSGQVNAEELQRALAQGGLNFSMKLVSSMIRMYDVDKTSQLTLPKFLVGVQSVFGAADHNRSGQLNLNEIYTALSTLELRPEPVCLDARSTVEQRHCGLHHGPRPSASRQPSIAASAAISYPSCVS